MLVSHTMQEPLLLISEFWVQILLISDFWVQILLISDCRANQEWQWRFILITIAKYIVQCYI